MSDAEPSNAFHFEVLPGDLPDEPPISAQEARGLETVVDIETVMEGGENRFVHGLPRQAKHANLVLKRVVVTPDNWLVRWCTETLAADLSRPIAPRDLHVSLLNGAGSPLASWSVTSAWPVTWSVEPHDTAANRVAVETVELSFTGIRRTL